MKTLLRADAEKSVFHSYMPCVFPVTLILIIFLSASQTSIAQDLRIKREAATGTVMEELGNHRVLINSRGQIVTLSELVHNDVVGTQQFQIISHTKQFQPLQRQEVSAVGPAFEVSSFIETNDQGYIMTGSMGKSPLGIDSGFIIKALKLRGNGSFEWERNFNGNADDKAVGVQQTPDGGFLLIANTLSSDINFQNTTGSSQIWLGKLDSSGNKVWGKLLTNTQTNEAIDFKKTKDGNYIVCGKVSDNVALGVDRSTGDGLILKFKEDGTIIWQQYLGGNSADEKLNRISIDESGNIFAAGFTFSNNGDF
ncbi:MAG TPA: hypothetical protein VK625_04985, partial [Flavitalea sp.]|nr:hypothetical protein [Flavitalea sp.]